MWHDEFDFDIGDYVDCGLSVRHKGGGGGGWEPTFPKLGPLGTEAERFVYGAATRGMRRQGLEPHKLAQKTRAYRLGGLTEAIDTAEMEFRSNVNRMVPRRDVRLRNYLDQVVGQAKATARVGFRESEKARTEEDFQTALQMGTQEVATATRVGADLLGAAQSAALQSYDIRKRYGTFGSNLAQGLGGMAGWMMAADRYGKTFG
jgi:hypothetical protein